MKLREATPSDLDALVEVVLASMPLDPQWDWRYPNRDHYPDDHRKYTRMLFSYFLDPCHDDWHVMVTEAACLQPPAQSRIAAFAVWDVSCVKKKRYANQQPQNPSLFINKAGGLTRPDASPARVNAFRETCAAARNDYFNTPYPNQPKLYLQILGTHPHHMRSGHATHLCKWGITKALQEQLIICVIASPMGKLLYLDLGFLQVGKVHIKVPTDDKGVSVFPMVCDDPRKSLRRRQVRSQEWLIEGDS